MAEMSGHKYTGDPSSRPRRIRGLPASKRHHRINGAHERSGGTAQKVTVPESLASCDPVIGKTLYTISVGCENVDAMFGKRLVAGVNPRPAGVFGRTRPAEGADSAPRPA